MRQLLHVVRREVMLVEQNKRLEQLNQFLHPLQISLRFHQRSLLQRQRRHDSLNRFHYRFLRRRRHPLVPLLRHRNRIKPQPQPRFQPYLRPVMLPVRQRRQLNRPPHIARVRHRRRQLIKRIVPPFHNRRRNQSHPRAHRVHRDNIQPLPLIRRQLPEIRSQQIRQRSRRINPFIPPQKRLRHRGLHNRRTHHRNRQPRSMLHHQRFRQALGQRVSIRPAQFLRPP